MLDLLRQHFEPGRPIAPELYQRLFSESDRVSFDAAGYIFCCSFGVWLTEKALVELGELPPSGPRGQVELKVLEVAAAPPPKRKSRAKR